MPDHHLPMRAPGDLAPLERLPLLTLYLTERCNSRCITCDYWRHGRADMSLATVKNLLPALSQLQTEAVLISGGEPLLNREWLQIAQTLQDAGIKLWLLTSGLALAKHVRPVAQLFDAVTVSLDGTCPATYAAIRGVDAFDKVCQGISAAADAGIPLNLRVTVQRANYRELPGFIDLARRLGASQVSFLAVDVANPHAFARTDGDLSDLALTSEDLPVLKDLIARVCAEHAASFASRFVAESPQKLHRLLDYFSAVAGQGEYPPVRCNAPEFSAVLESKGRLRPCFFIDSPSDSVTGGLRDALNHAPMQALRQDIKAGRRVECQTCVCSMWRPLDEGGALFASLGARAPTRAEP